MDRYTITIDRATATQLHALKRAWDLATLDDVIRRAIAPYRADMITAAGVEVRLPEGVTDGQSK